MPPPAKRCGSTRIPSAIENFRFGAGPHATPLIVGDRLFTAGTNKQRHALDKSTGKVLWSHDLVKDFGAPPTLIRPAVKAGYGCSPLAWKDTIICSVGGRGQALMVTTGFCSCRRRTMRGAAGCA